MAESSSPALPGDVEWLPGPGGTWVLRIHPASAESPALILRVLGGGERRIEAGPTPVTEYAIPAELDWSAAWLQWADGTRAALPLPHGPHAEVIELRPRRFARNEPPAEAGWRGEIAPPVREALEAASRLELGDDNRSPRAADATPGDHEPSGAAAVTRGDDEAPRVAGAAHAIPGVAGGDQTTPDAAGAVSVDPPAPGDARHAGRRARRPRLARRGGRRVGRSPPAPGDHATPGVARGDHASPDAAGAVSSDQTAPGAPAVSPGDHATSGTVSGDHDAPGTVAAAPGDDEAPGAAVSPEPAGPSWTTPPQPSDSTREAEAVWRERRDDLRRELSEAADAIARARDGERTARDAVLTALAAARADLRASRAAREADASALTAVTGELGAERAAHAVTRGSVGTLADALSAARAELAAARTRGEATQADLEVARAELVAARATGAAELAEARSDASQARAEAASLRDALAARDRPLAGRGDLGRLAREQAEAAAVARRSPEVSAELLANLDAAAAALRAAVSPRRRARGRHRPRAQATAVPASSVDGGRAAGLLSGAETSRAPGSPAGLRPLRPPMPAPRPAATPSRPARPATRHLRRPVTPGRRHDGPGHASIVDARRRRHVSRRGGPDHACHPRRSSPSAPSCGCGARWSRSLARTAWPPGRCSSASCPPRAR